MLSVFILTGVFLFSIFGLTLYVIFTLNAVLALQEQLKQLKIESKNYFLQLSQSTHALIEAFEGISFEDKMFLQRLKFLRDYFLACETGSLRQELFSAFDWKSELGSCLTFMAELPDLSSNPELLVLKAKLQNLQTKIHDSLLLQNDLAVKFNTLIQRWPGELYSKMFDWKPVSIM